MIDSSERRFEGEVGLSFCLGFGWRKELDRGSSSKQGRTCCVLHGSVLVRRGGE